MLYSSAERSSTGLLEWDSKGDAIEALTVCNHSQIPNPSKLRVDIYAVQSL